MKKIILFCILLVLSICPSLAQSEAYSQKKANKIKEGSVFTKIINRELPATIVYEDKDIIAFVTIVYEDKDIIAFVPLRLQAKVHLLIVPKKEIYTINDINDEDTSLLGKMFLVAKRLAQENGIAETGYRLALNNNEDAGQSVFHLHMHL
jgi:histidine triad (HIT) family protein